MSFSDTRTEYSTGRIFFLITGVEKKKKWDFCEFRRNTNVPSEDRNFRRIISQVSKGWAYHKKRTVQNLENIKIAISFF